MTKRYRNKGIVKEKTIRSPEETVQFVVGKVYRSKRKDIWKWKVKLLKGLQSNILVRD